MQLATRLSVIQPSPTLALNARAKALAAKGIDLANFAAGEPDFNVPAHIQDAIVAALKSGATKYTATAGTPELRAAISEALLRDNALTFAPEQIIVTVGAKHALYSFFQAVLNPGDEVIVFSPFWPSYPEMVALAGGKPVVVTTREEDGFCPDAQSLRRALTPKTRAIILNSPSNPTGAVTPQKTLVELAKTIADHSCLVVTDDIYEKLCYVDAPFQNILNAAPNLSGRVVVVNGWSKAYAMTGLRLGYAAGPKEIISAMQLIQDQSTSNPTSIVQSGGVAALKGPKAPIAEMVKEFRARRELFVSGLNAIPGVRCRMPEGAFYVFPNVEGLLRKSYKGEPIGTSQRLSDILVDDVRVVAMPGAPFGAEGYLRLSFATSREVIQKGLDRLSAFAKSIG
ncbi:MAG: pyridoxal phosphate-dependent aminotransferase [Myxococcaceae bacterium]